MWTKIVNFFNANKVFILGLLSALAVVLQQFLGVETVDWLALGFAAFIAILSYIANEWRGQGMTILGIIGTVAGVLSSNLIYGQHLDWGKLILLILAAIITAAAPPPKNASYEKAPAIEDAKNQPK